MSEWIRCHINLSTDGFLIDTSVLYDTYIMKRCSHNIDAITASMCIIEIDVFLRLYYCKQSYRLLPQLISAPWHFSAQLFIDELLEDKRERFHWKISLTNACASTFDVNHPRMQQHHSNG